METKANFALIGGLVILAMVGLAGFTLWLGQSQFNRDFDVYEIVFEGPVTLEPGASVRFNGITVGEVTRVALDRGNDRLIRSRVRVNSDTPVRTDSVADVEFAGITGLTFVQIRAGSPNAPLLERMPGEPLPVIRSEPNPISEIFASGAQALDAANSSLESLGGVLSDDNVEAFGATLQNLSTITGSFADEEGLTTEFVTTMASVRQASDDFAEASRAVTALSADADELIAMLNVDAGDLIADLRGTVSNVNELLETVDGTVGSANNVFQGPATEALEEVRLASQDLRLLVQRLDGIARELQQNPQSIVIGDPKPYEEGQP